MYQEYISDKYHVHMNSTRWVTLTEFVKHLGRTGVARVDETEKGWFIAWIDSSPKALAKAVGENPSVVDLILMLMLFLGSVDEEGEGDGFGRAEGEDAYC